MRIGVPREIKDQEYRIGLTADSVSELIRHGHEVFVETNAGLGIGSRDEQYHAVGAQILESMQEVYAQAEIIVKVKELQKQEREILRPDHIIFSYLHLAPDYEQTRDLVESGAICLAYETVMDVQGGLPLLAPMSQVAGRLAVQAGAYCLERTQGGKGILLGGVPGVPPAKVLVLGGGVVGRNAILMAFGLGAEVTVIDRNVDVLTTLAHRFGNPLKTVYSTRSALEQYVLQADLVIGAVLVAGAGAPKLVTADMVKRMKPGSVLVDVAIDQGGCFETSKPTTHTNPTYIIDNVVHYCVTNMPGIVPNTATYALNNVTLPYTLLLADKGYKQALLEHQGFCQGLNICRGKVTYQAVAEEHGYPYHPADDLLRSL